MFKLDRKDHG